MTSALVMAVQAAKLGYKWIVGEVRLRMICVLTLAIPFWAFCVLCSEKNVVTIREVWDANDLNLTFRSTFCDSFMSR